LASVDGVLVGYCNSSMAMASGEILRFCDELVFALRCLQVECLRNN